MSHQMSQYKPSLLELAKIYFDQPSYSRTQQYLLLECSLRQSIIIINQSQLSSSQNQSDSILQKKKQFLNKKQRIEVNDDMTIQQIRNKWYQINQRYLQHKGKQKYILSYDKKIALQQKYDIKHVKSLIGINFLNHKAKTILVQFQPESSFHKNQSAVDLTKMQAYKIKIQIPIKIINKNKYPVYFYINCYLQTTIDQLKHNYINNYLKSQNSLVFYDPQYKYTLLIDTNQFSQQSSKQIEKQLKDQDDSCLKNYINNDGTLDFTTQVFQQLNVRQVCPPGQIIVLNFAQSQKARYLVEDKQSNCSNPIIKILYYQKQLRKSQSNQNQNIKQSKKGFSQPFIYECKYSSICDIKVSTILKQQCVKDPLLTSVYKGDLIIHPNELFSSLKPIIDKQKLNEIQLIALTQSILFYKQIKQYGTLKDKIKKDFDNIFEQMLQSDKRVDETKRDNYRNVYNERKSKLKNIGTKQSLFYPILCYTSPCIYADLNEFLRDTSLSVYQKENANKNHLQWFYPFCNQLISSLNKLPNYYGITFRGSMNRQYVYKKGEIIEWNSFSSSSKHLNTPKQYLKVSVNYPYLFAIQSFTGKLIHQYSFYQDQKEILFLPYTRFKILQISAFDFKKQVKQQQDNQAKLITYEKVNFVRMRQIPTPKKIPGHLVIWIDAKIWQNSKAFNKIIQKYKLQEFDLIQLDSNYHLQLWFEEYKYVFSLPGVKIHFITNMDQYPNYDGEGIRTLQMIRQLNQDQFVLFYVDGLGHVQNTKEVLIQNGIDLDDRLRVICNVEQLQKVIKQQFNDKR